MKSGKVAKWQSGRDKVVSGKGQQLAAREWQSGKAAEMSGCRAGGMCRVAMSTLNSHQPSTLNPQPSTRRGGAVLIVVMALLGTLTFLGFLYYTFAAQEQVNAEYFASAPPIDYPPSGFEDWALEQLILGTRPTLGNSALFGSNWSLIPNMIGRPGINGDTLILDDVNPFDGLGIGVHANATNDTTLGAGEFIFDYTGDGAADANHTDFRLNFSRAANAGNIGVGVDLFHPDAGYTYPDVNSMFLAFDGIVRNPNTGEQHRVIIPSFHRPQYFPAMRGINAATANAFQTIFEANALNTQDKVLRPHALHVNAAAPGVARFLTSVLEPPNVGSGDTTRTIQPFPFRVNINNDGISNQAGVWSFPAVTDPNDPSSTIYEYDVDVDGDGFRDAIWMDLDHAIMDLPDGRQFVPLFAFKVIDADALLNVNAHGNMNGVFAKQWDGTLLDETGAPAALLSEYLSSSNQGMSRSEINLGMGLTANPATQLAAGITIQEAQEQLVLNVQDGPTLQTDPPNPQPEFSFGTLSPPQLSNLELMMLLIGRENYRDIGPSGNPGNWIVDSRVEGRWGDDLGIAGFYSWLQGNGTYSPPPTPGGFRMDDDGDSNMLGFARFWQVNDYPNNQQPPGLPPIGAKAPPTPPTADFGGDDDINSPPARSGGGSAFRDPHLAYLWVPPYVHPLDYGGTGSGYLLQSGAGSPWTRRVSGLNLTGGVTNPGRWLSYVDPATNPYWQVQYTAWDPVTAAPSGPTSGYLVRIPWSGTAALGFRSLYGVRPYWEGLANANGQASNLLQLANFQLDFLRDEGSEVILERSHRNPEYDFVFPTYEMEALLLSSEDFQNVGGQSRIRGLATVNLDKLNDVAGRQVRSRLTTDSWDRLDYAHGRSAAMAPTAPRDWEFTNWTGTGVFSSVSGKVFPPQFGSATPVQAGSAADPLRQEIRLLLKSEEQYRAYLNTDTGARRYPRHKLNINRILSDDATSAPAPPASDPYRYTAFNAGYDPRFRNLVPHPDIIALNLANPPASRWGADTITLPNMLHANGAAIPADVPFSNLAGVLTNAANRLAVARTQEWWARYDRQRLARDIYTLLWVLGHGDDARNTTTQAAAYTPEQARQMAQFAVNYVDALDRDDAITRFDYDVDLSNGWNPTGSDYVYGVEAQSLTLSEVLWIQTTSTSNDEDKTMWDDRDAHEFLYIELRNISPFDVELRNDSWRIARYNPGRTPGVDEPDASFVFTTDAANNNIRNVVKAGRTFLIGCHDNLSTVNASGSDQVRSSDFYVNDGSGTEFDQIVPYRIDGTDTNEQELPVASGDHPEPTLDLDLSYTGPNEHRNRFEFDHPAPINSADPAPLNPGETLVSTDATWDGIDAFTLVLQRRTSLRTDGVVAYPDTEAEWIEVDRFEEVQITPRIFNASESSVTDQLDLLTSSERNEPLDRSNVSPHGTGTGTPPRNHTLGSPDFVVTAAGFLDPTVNANTQDRNRGNSTSPAEYTIWQPHFDRDFSSVFELLSVPLFGPQDTTLKLVQQAPASTPKRLTGWYRTPTESDPEPSTALAKFLYPFLDLNGDGTRDYDVNGDGTVDVGDDNRWYRLFELLTVPDDGDDAIRRRLARIVRKPGKVNLNTVRDEAVLAALLDDQHINRMDDLTFAMTDDTLQGAARNWYRELVLARDGIDPLIALNGGGAIPLPGVPGVPPDRTTTTSDIQYGAIPFRSMSYVAPNVSVWPDSRRLDKSAHTILRRHVTDDAGFTTRVAGLDDLGLFEARPTTDLGTDQVDFHTRNRLLSKVANHTTNRSNVFAVWLTVGYFEAHQPDPVNNPNVVQIGGELAGSTRKRSFFVIDRTKLEDAVQVDDGGTPADPDDDVLSLNWRSFVLHRRTLPE